MNQSMLLKILPSSALTYKKVANSCCVLLLGKSLFFQSGCASNSRFPIQLQTSEIIAINTTVHVVFIYHLTIGASRYGWNQGKSNYCIRQADKAHNQHRHKLQSSVKKRPFLGKVFIEFWLDLKIRQTLFIIQ